METFYVYLFFYSLFTYCYGIGLVIGTYQLTENHGFVDYLVLFLCFVFSPILVPIAIAIKSF